MLNEAKPEECTGKCEEAEKAKTREDVLKDAKRDPKRPTLDDGSEQYVKPGGMPEADADFDAMNPRNVRSVSEKVRIGELGDGTQLVVRPLSKPSLEINPKSGTPVIIRYK